MSEVFIDSMPQVDYSAEPREVINYLGETAGLIHLNPADPIDMANIRRIEREAIDINPVFERGKDTDQKLIDWVRKAWLTGDNDMYPTLPFGIVTTDKTPGIDASQVGEVIGWVNFYLPDNPEREAKHVEQGFIPEDHTLIIESSCAKLPDAPSGHMASGIRQAFQYLLQAFPETDENGRPKLQIVSYIEPGNEASLRMTEAAGRKRMSLETVHEGEPNERQEYYYVLDWDKLNEISHAKADAEITARNTPPETA